MSSAQGPFSSASHQKLLAGSRCNEPLNIPLDPHRVKEYEASKLAEEKGRAVEGPVHQVNPAEHHNSSDMSFVTKPQAFLPPHGCPADGDSQAEAGKAPSSRPVRRRTPTSRIPACGEADVYAGESYVAKTTRARAVLQKKHSAFAKTVGTVDCSAALLGNLAASQGQHTSEMYFMSAKGQEQGSTPSRLRSAGGGVEAMSKMYFHKRKLAWRAEALIDGTKRQKSFSCKLYGCERARKMCKWVRNFVVRAGRLPTDEETCASLSALVECPLPSEQGGSRKLDIKKLLQCFPPKPVLVDGTSALLSRADSNSQTLGNHGLHSVGDLADDDEVLEALNQHRPKAGLASTYQAETVPGAQSFVCQCLLIQTWAGNRRLMKSQYSTVQQTLESSGPSIQQVSSDTTLTSATAPPERVNSPKAPGEFLFPELAYLSRLTRPRIRIKRRRVGKKPHSGVRGMYFQQGSWKVNYRGLKEAASKLFPYPQGDLGEMKRQHALARLFLKQVIEKNRQLHDSDGDGLSDEEPGKQKNSHVFLPSPAEKTVMMRTAMAPKLVHAQGTGLYVKKTQGSISSRVLSPSSGYYEAQAFDAAIHNEGAESSLHGAAIMNFGAAGESPLSKNQLAHCNAGGERLPGRRGFQSQEMPMEECAKPSAAFVPPPVYTLKQPHAIENEGPELFKEVGASQQQPPCQTLTELNEDLHTSAAPSAADRLRPDTELFVATHRRQPLSHSQDDGCLPLHPPPNSAYAFFGEYCAQKEILQRERKSELVFALNEGFMECPLLCAKHSDLTADEAVLQPPGVPPPRQRKFYPPDRVSPAMRCSPCAPGPLSVGKSVGFKEEEEHSGHSFSAVNAGPSSALPFWGNGKYSAFQHRRSLTHALSTDAYIALKTQLCPSSSSSRSSIDLLPCDLLDEELASIAEPDRQQPDRLSRYELYV
ncbi:hypothetical protein Esti_000045 [Eimeria stiedai]